MTKQKILLFSLAIAGFSLQGCENAKEQLGLEKKAPDEFAVVKRAPLEMPPNYNLRPPHPGAPRPQEQSTNVQARETVFGAEQAAVQPDDDITAAGGEAALLQQIGAGRADPAIRRKVDAESEELKDYNKPVAQRLFGIGGDSDRPSASIVDAKQESERIQKNLEEGKTVTEGETPSIEQ